MCSETYNIRLGKTSNKRDSRIIFSMLDTIPSWAIKFQHPVQVSIQWNVVELTVRVFKAKSEEVIRESNAPGIKDLGHKCFIDAFECRMNEVVGTNVLSDGEDHVSK